MSSAARSRTIAAELPAVWAMIADPHHQPRWWPGVTRMEGVQGRRFTQVLTTARGRPVRADWTVCELQEPTLAVWRQELDGTPFARVLHEATIHFEMGPDPGGTAVTITQVQRPRGYSRTGGIMIRRASARRLDQALDGLARIVVD